MRLQFRVTIFILLILTLFGCKPPPTYDMAKADVANTENKISLIEAEQLPPPAPVVTMSGAYVDPEKVSLVRDRAWLRQRLTVHGNKLPFVFYVDQILGDTGTRIIYDTTINKRMPLSIDYTGSIRGALEELATVSGYHYEVDNKNDSVKWSAMVTKVFSIRFMPGTSTFEIGQTLDLESSGSDSGSSGSVQAITDSQFSNLKGSLSVWRDIEAAISKLLSKDGNFTVSQGTTTVTVTDHPQNVANVKRYIDKINIEMSRQVRIQVQILEVQLTDEFAYGINWDVVRTYISNTSASALRLVAPGFTNVNISSLSPAAFSYTAKGGKFAETNTVISALQQQGQVSIVTQPMVTTLNNQVAQLSIQELQNYVSGSNVSQNDNGNTGGPETSTVTTGLNMYLLPKIIKDKVYLQISSVLSNLVSLDSFNVFTGSSSDSLTGSNSGSGSSNKGGSNGGGSNTDGNSSNNNTENNDSGTTVNFTGSDTIDAQSAAAIASAITQSSIPSFVQLPKVDARLINQRAVIKNGSTLILAGYKANQSQAKNNKFYEFDRLGAQSSERENRELVFLITPVIIDEDEYFEDQG